MNVFLYVNVLEKDLCVFNLCKNEGYCELFGFFFNCYCVVGYKGIYCEGKYFFKIVESRKRYFKI